MQGPLLAFALAGCGVFPTFGFGAAGGNEPPPKGGSGESLGAVLGRDNETYALRVREVRAGSGADAAGLTAGDEIIMIDGYFARELGAKAIRERLRGPAGSTMSLTVVRGERVLHLSVTRGVSGAARGDKPEGREERIAE